MFSGKLPRTASSEVLLSLRWLLPTAFRRLNQAEWSLDRPACLFRLRYDCAMQLSKSLIRRQTDVDAYFSLRYVFSGHLIHHKMTARFVCWLSTVKNHCFPSRIEGFVSTSAKFNDGAAFDAPLCKSAPRCCLPVRSTPTPRRFARGPPAAQSLKGISPIAWGCHSAAPATPGHRPPHTTQL
jgi:hypothetical protein